MDDMARVLNLHSSSLGRFIRISQPSRQHKRNVAKKINRKDVGCPTPISSYPKRERTSHIIHSPSSLISPLQVFQTTPFKRKGIPQVIPRLPEAVSPIVASLQNSLAISLFDLDSSSCSFHKIPLWAPVYESKHIKRGSTNEIESHVSAIVASNKASVFRHVLDDNFRRAD